MPVIYGQVGAPGNTSLGDGTNNPALQGKAAELIVAELHGKYYTNAYRGTAYIGSAGAGGGAGVIPPIYTTTAQVFGLWNRAGNTRNAVPQTLDVAPITFGAAVVGCLSLSESLNAGSALATGGISAFTPATPQNANGGTGGNSVSFTATAATTLAATMLMVLNYGFYSTVITGLGALGLHYDFEGGVIIPPNVGVWLTGNVAQTATFGATLRWEEPAL